VLAGFAAAIAAPVVEEVFFRGFLYRSLRNRLPIIPAALLVGVIFGLGHTQYPLLERPNQALFGFVTCLLYERTGSLLPGIAIHSFIDASGFEAALTGTSWIVLVIFLALAGAILIKPSLRALRRLFSRGGRVVTE
jgi:membrane protease YdiL (CAAX protease family)